MQNVGEITHLASSGRVIIQLRTRLTEGQILCDEKGTSVAKIMELIGPVRRPFASATPLTNSIKKYVGKSVFTTTEPTSASTQKKQSRRRKK